MGGERSLWRTLLTIYLVFSSCVNTFQKEDDGLQNISISIAQEGYHTRAYDPDEDLIKDINLLIFNDAGILEEHIWLSGTASDDNNGFKCQTSLLKHRKYSFYACGNYGSKLSVSDIDDLGELKWYLVYPDDYREGLPMSGKAEDVFIDDSTECIYVPLERLMAKISICIDRGGLSDDVTMQVTSVRIGNCPKSSKIFTDNRADDTDDLFTVGFYRNETECISLNRNIGNGISAELSLYMLENKQGLFRPEGIKGDEEKTFDKNDRRQEFCSYIELKMDYCSSTYHTSEIPLIYRFYLGEDLNSLDIERNCHYHITVIPEDDGLSGSGWRVDKTGIKENDDTVFFKMSPSGYIQGDIGDSINVRCRIHPSDTPFDIGIEELENDRERGLYDYSLDEDGYGVTLYLRKPGRGIIYMEAGEPINESGILMVEINNYQTSEI